MNKYNNKCFNCKFASPPFKIAGKTYHQCTHSKHEDGFINGILSPYDTLQEWYNTCSFHSLKDKGKLKDTFSTISISKEKKQKLKENYNNITELTNILWDEYLERVEKIKHKDDRSKETISKDDFIIINNKDYKGFKAKVKEVEVKDDSIVISTILQDGTYYSIFDLNDFEFKRVCKKSPTTLV